MCNTKQNTVHFQCPLLFIEIYYAISNKIICIIQHNTLQYLTKYCATFNKLPCNIFRNTLQYQEKCYATSKKYCAISKELRCNIQRNTVEYLRSVVTCSVGGDRNVTRERDAAHRPITAGLLVWHNFYMIFHIVLHLYFIDSVKCISITAGLCERSKLASLKARLVWNYDRPTHPTDGGEV